MSLRALIFVGVMGFFSPIQRLLSSPTSRGGALRTYQVAMACWPLVTLGFPLISFMKRAEIDEIWIWAVTVIWLAVWR